MRATREAHNPNLQVVIIWMHRMYICSQILQHSFGLALRMNGIHRMQFDHARLELPSLVIWSCAFWLSVTWNLQTALHILRLLLVIINYICHYNHHHFCYNAREKILKVLMVNWKLPLKGLSTNQRPKTRLHKTKHPTDVKLKGVD